MSKYKVYCFQHSDLEDKDYFAWPCEDSYETDNTGTVADIVSNCTRKASGMRKVVIYIDESDDRGSVGIDDATQITKNGKVIDP